MSSVSAIAAALLKTCRYKHASGARGALVAGVLALAGLQPQTSYASAPVGVFGGEAYGTFANLAAGPLAIGLGITAYQPCGCLGTAGQTRVTRLDSLSVGKVATAGAIVSTATTAETSVAAVEQTTARVAGLSLLDGLIQADGILAVSYTRATATGFQTADTGSAFVNLRVGGKVIDVNVKPNTTLALPGIGEVVLKQETPTSSAKGASLNVQMIVVKVKIANKFGLPIGANLVVAHARTGFILGSVKTLVSGQASAVYGNVSVGSLLQDSIGLTAFEGVPCLGTGGKTLRNSVEAIGAGNLVSIGTGLTTAFGGPNASGGVAKTTASVSGIKLLGGLIGATAITSAATTTMTNGVLTYSTAGTQFAKLTVLGIPLPINVKPNTKINLPGIGFVLLNEQDIPTNPNSPLVVNGIHIYVTKANLLHLPVGANIIVAHATSIVFPQTAPAAID